MNVNVAMSGISLKSAVVEYCDRVYVHRVKLWERLQPSEMLRKYEIIFSQELSTRTSDITEPDLEEAYAHTYREWRLDLEKDFRKRIINGEIILCGIQTKPTRMSERSVIPGAWAADCIFDFRNDMLCVDDVIFHNVEAHAVTPMGVTCAHQAPSSLVTVTQDNIRSLTDEEVLLLLEDHARRVVEHPDSKLVEPGKISLMPIVRRKMLHRAECALTRETLAAEAAELEAWIATKVPSHHVPKASTIENVLRSEYRSLRPRSKATMP
ncbi:hypothetical protein E2C06_15700 [Dankookia rubra]|uniref:Uncharacterized protein n=1 Tax=Dankookia rubra TaxID=1442381 RepID=A0A4R5QFV1_9PROT|nr:hypothetical protein [Dankookia rubra]TDH61578.1 hypothetical protein E2C06_15700 [Dankookia rubra]